MSKFLLRSMVLPCLALVTVCSAVTASTPSRRLQKARLDCFVHPDGSSYFALSVQPPAAVAAAGPRDVVILVSTSASQGGEYRTQSFQALDSLVTGLGPAARVQLIAVDLKAIPLTKGFVAPGSAEWKAALAALNLRAPLGSNDMDKALSAAAASFTGEAKNPRAVVYIGDGSSRANPLSPERFQQLAGSLAAGHIPVLSYGVGPRVDRELLGLLARQTGGVLLDGAGNDAGTRLATATTAAVYWPTAAVKWPAGMGEVLPKAMPPLRSDRDTVLIGTLKGKEPMRIEVTVDGPGGADAGLECHSVSEHRRQRLSALAGIAGPARRRRSLPLVELGQPGRIAAAGAIRRADDGQAGPRGLGLRQPRWRRADGG